MIICGYELLENAKPQAGSVVRAQLGGKMACFPLGKWKWFINHSLQPDNVVSFYVYIHTLHCITLRYITLHYITLHYITLHYITWVFLGPPSLKSFQYKLIHRSNHYFILLKRHLIHHWCSLIPWLLGNTLVEESSIIPQSHVTLQLLIVTSKLSIDIHTFYLSPFLANNLMLSSCTFT